MSALPRFEGASKYIADDALKASVNAAIVLERPLLVKGEPGTGKTLLARAVAESLNMPLLTWHIKSTTKAIDGIYSYDVVQRLNDARFNDGDVSDIRKYIRLGPLGEALSMSQRAVLLIDEIDKADIEFPNDLLRELDEMSFTIPELGETVKAQVRPLMLITSNAERELPDAFLRRCIFHYIDFPDRDRLRAIVDAHHPDLDDKMIEVASEAFFRLRQSDGFRKRPSTSEFLDWLLVLSRCGVSLDRIKRELPYVGVLLKQEQDLELAERLRNRGLLGRA